MRRFFAAAALALALLLAAAPARTRAEEAAARAERFDSLVESLNAPSSRRARVLENIHAELRGENSREMHDLLLDALSRTNSLILNGVTEALAMFGAAPDVDALAALLATTDSLEVKTAVIRLLPAFCLPAERARFNYIQYAAGYARAANPAVLEPLRRPPLTRRGRLDSALEHIRERVAGCVVGQFDPVGAALRHMDDPRLKEAAAATVSHFVGKALGNEPALWARIWAAQSAEMDYLVPDEIEEIRLAALNSLSDMGAEGLPEVIAALRRLAAPEDAILSQALFDTMAVMCRSAYAAYPALSTMQFGAEDKVEAEHWRSRRYASSARLAAATAAEARRALAAEPDGSVFGSATDALGAALSFPDGYPDAEGELERAKSAGLSTLERLLLTPDISREKRAAVARALGDVGTRRAVSALAGIIGSPYCSPEFGADGQRMAEAALDAVRAVATGSRDGARDARETLLSLLADARTFPAPRPGVPPVELGHMALWRLQRLAKSADVSMEPAIWRGKLGW